MKSNKEDIQWLKNVASSYLSPPVNEDIPTWASHAFFLPSETSEPGLYNVNRAPYQYEILKAMSPKSHVREVVLSWGAQMGKTICEQIGMQYYMAAYPRPQAFAFSNDGELKAFVKTKFNPYLAVNSEVKRVLGRNTRTSGDTLDEKLYPGGFLRFISANTEANMRSYSVAVLFADEIDTYPSDVGGNGSPILQLKKRTNAFADTRKIIFSSTPANSDSKILSLMEESTYNKYFVKCPHCQNLFTFEFENFHYDTNAEGKTVTDAWFDCPSCGLVFHNGDKTELLKAENGAKWMSTNTSASEDRQGFFLPSFYAPVGWLSWMDIAQEYLDAINASEEDRLFRLIAFNNTVLCRQFNEVGDRPEERPLIQRGADSLYKRGIAPNWVDVITTGADVQKNRVEVTVMGWGKRLRHIPIDHYIIALPPKQEITDLNNIVWKEYKERIIDGVWEREDGCVLQSVANALDRGYESRTIDNFYRAVASERLCPVRGVSLPKGTSVTPSLKHAHTQRGADATPYYDVPVDQIKRVVYQSLLADRTYENYLYTDFPQGYSTEFFDQLLSEHIVVNRKTGLEQWEKIRDRNEVLDCFVYNFAMIYLLQVDSLTDEEWDELAQSHAIAEQIPEEARQEARTLRRRRGTVSQGLKYSLF